MVTLDGCVPWASLSVVFLGGFASILERRTGLIDVLVPVLISAATVIHACA